MKLLTFGQIFYLYINNSLVHEAFHLYGHKCEDVAQYKLRVWWKISFQLLARPLASDLRTKTEKKLHYVPISFLVEQMSM